MYPRKDNTPSASAEARGASSFLVHPKERLYLLCVWRFELFRLFRRQGFVISLAIAVCASEAHTRERRAIGPQGPSARRSRNVADATLQPPPDRPPGHRGGLELNGPAWTRPGENRTANQGRTLGRGRPCRLAPALVGNDGKHVHPQRSANEPPRLAPRQRQGPARQLPGEPGRMARRVKSAVFSAGQTLGSEGARTPSAPERTGRRASWGSGAHGAGQPGAPNNGKGPGTPTRGVAVGQVARKRGCKRQ